MNKDVHKLNVGERRMLIWMCSLAIVDKVRIENRRQ